MSTLPDRLHQLLEAQPDPLRSYFAIKKKIVRSCNETIHSRVTANSEVRYVSLQDLTLAPRDKIPRKGGPGITKSDLLVINKIDLAPYVGASLEVMERDTKKMRGDKPFVFTNLKSKEGLEKVINFIEAQII